MTAADLQLSHQVELEISLNGKKTTLLSSIEKILDNTILLTPIQMNGKLVGFPPECQISLLYIEDPHVYCWSGLTVKAVRYENNTYHSAVLVGDAETLNRRGAYRVYIGEDMMVAAATAAGPKLHRVLVKDISETGMAFLSSENFDIGRNVRLQLKLSSGQILQLAYQIIRTQEPSEGRNDILYGCKLIERNKLLTAYLMRVQQDRQRQRMGRN